MSKILGREDVLTFTVEDLTGPGPVKVCVFLDYSHKEEGRVLDFRRITDSTFCRCISALISLRLSPSPLKRL